MLTLEIGREVVVEEGGKVRFVTQVDYVLELEHSLTSLSKWEAKWEKPFLIEEPHTAEQIINYIECMVMTPNPPEDFVDRLTQANIDAVNNYINAKMTATWFNEDVDTPQRTNTEKITYELIMYWLSNLPSLPPGFEHWHLNRLFTFIKIHDVKNRKPQKQDPAKSAAARRALNERNRAKYNSQG